MDGRSSFRCFFRKEGKLRTIYFDNAGCSEPIPEAIDAFNAVPQWNPASAHTRGEAARRTLEMARESIAKSIDAEPSEVYFTSGSTESCTWAKQVMLDSCEVFYISPAEHPATKTGFREASIVKPRVKKERPYMEGCIHSLANSETGEVFSFHGPKNRFIERHFDKTQVFVPNNALLLVDATAAVGHIPVSFREIGADYMAFDAQKFGGYAGVGCLIVKKGAPLFPLILGGGQENGMRSGTIPLKLISAMEAALSFHTENMRKTMDYVTHLRDALIDGVLSSVEGAQINGPYVPESTKERLPGNVNISFDGVEATSLAAILDAKGLIVSTGSACTSGDGPAPSEALLSMGYSEKRAKSAIRMTLDHRNTMEEVKKSIDIIKNTVKDVRSRY